MPLYKITYRNFLLCAVICFIFSVQARSQAVYCPPNLDFEDGNYNYWQFFTGSCCPLNATSSSGPVSNRHTLTTGAAVDPYGGFPIVAPGGGNYSLKLGNSNTGAEAERARYYIHVPASVNNYSLIYRYAVVFEDPNHSISEQPRFEVKAYDSATNAPITCAQYTYIASSNLPGFLETSPNSSIWYKSWTTASLDLSGLAGKTIAVDFASGDCDLGGHFGYGYIDMSCGLFQIQAVNCNNSPTTTLNAPPGFQSYVWMDASFSATIGNGQSITIPTPAASTQYHVILTPYTGFGCPDTLTTSIAISNLSLSVSNDTLICANTSVSLNATGAANGTPSALYYSWTPSAGLSCTNCNSPVATPTTSTKYYVTLSDEFGCNKVDSVQVDISPDAVVSKTDISCYGSGAGTAAATILSGTPPYTYSWNTSPIQTTASVSGLLAGNYTVSITDANGCIATHSVTITQPLTPITITVDHVSNVSCYGLSDGAIQTTTTGGTPPYSYSWDNNTSLNSNNINNLTAGIHTLVVTDANGCKDSIHITLTQPQQEPAPTVTSPIAYCVNEPALQLNAMGTNLKWYAASGGPATTIPPTPSTGVAGTYKWYVTQTLNGCEGARDSIIVVVHHLPTISFAPATPTICVGESISLTASGGTSYTWTTSPTLDKDTGNTVMANPITTTTYSIVVSDANNCVDTAAITVTVNDPPVLSISKDTAICFLQSAQIITSGASSYTWSNPEGLSCNNCANPIATPTATTTYTVVGTNQYNCKDTAEVTLTVHPLPVLEISTDTTICAGESAQLFVSGAMHYSWMPSNYLSCNGCGNPQATPPHTTRYNVVGTDQYGCYDSVKVTVTVIEEQPFTYSNNDTICKGERINLFATGGDRYEWYPTHGLDNPGADRPTASPDTTITYSVYVSLGNCFFDTGKIALYVNPQPFIDAGPDKTMNSSTDMVLLDVHATDALQFTWTPAYNLDCYSCQSPRAFPNETTTYYVEVVNGICKAIDSVRVNVGCQQSRVYIPNTFTPNADGIND